MIQQNQNNMIFKKNNNFIVGKGAILNNKIYFAYGDGFYEFLSFYDLNSSIINLEEIVTNGIYLYYKKQNPVFEIKDIQINLEGLTVYDVSLKQKENRYKAFITIEQLENICQNISGTFINNTDLEQTQFTNSCLQKVVKTTTIQKLNGFSKTETKSD